MFPLGVPTISKSVANHECKVCRGRGHVPTQTGVTRCRCVVLALSKAAMYAAGFHEAYARMPLCDLAKYVQPKAAQFLLETKLDDLWIHGPPTDQAREYLAAYIARSFSDDGMTDGRREPPISGLKLSRLIDSRFDRDDRDRVDAIIARSSMMVFTVDDVGDHKKIPSVMDDLIAARRGSISPTLYLSQANLAKASGRYGPGVSMFFESFKAKMKLGATNMVTLLHRGRGQG